MLLCCDVKCHDVLCCCQARKASPATSDAAAAAAAAPPPSQLPPVAGSSAGKQGIAAAALAAGEARGMAGGCGLRHAIHQCISASVLCLPTCFNVHSVQRRCVVDANMGSSVYLVLRVQLVGTVRECVRAFLNLNTWSAPTLVTRSAAAVDRYPGAPRSDRRLLGCPTVLCLHLYCHLCTPCSAGCCQQEARRCRQHPSSSTAACWTGHSTQRCSSSSRGRG